MSAQVTAKAVKARDPLEAGLFHHRAGNIAKAEAAYKRALSRNPKDAAALHLLGLCALDKGRAERALQLVNKALAIAPDIPDYLHSAGHILAVLDRLEDAATHYEAALKRDPDRVLTLSNLGNVLKRMGRFDDGAEHLSRAVILDPDFAAGWSNLGLVHRERKDFEAAIAAFSKAIKLQPGEAEFHYNLANARLAAGDHGGAITGFEHALSLNPAHLRARMNLASALKQSGDVAGAIARLETAIELSPANAEAHWNLGLALLQAGDWQRGWAEYEWRRHMDDYGLTEPKKSKGGPWNGAPLEGARLLILHEQGFGDALQFMRFAADAKALGGHIIYRGPKPMLDIIGTMAGVGETSALDDPMPKFDTFIPMMSLPHVLKLGGGGLSRGAYLSADADTRRLENAPGMKIGITWQGNPDYRADHERSVPLRFFETLAALDNVTLISLQKGFGSEQVADWPHKLPLIDLGADIDADGGAFMETAAVLAGLDCVVTSDTALAHLGGAMGKPVHVALPHVPDWRWGVEGTASLWYPTMTLHRQARPGDWEGVFATIKEALLAR